MPNRNADHLHALQKEREADAIEDQLSELMREEEIREEEATEGGLAKFRKRHAGISRDPATRAFIRSHLETVASRIELEQKHLLDGDQNLGKLDTYAILLLEPTKFALLILKVVLQHNRHTGRAPTLATIASELGAACLEERRNDKFRGREKDVVSLITARLKKKQNKSRARPDAIDAAAWLDDLSDHDTCVQRLGAHLIHLAHESSDFLAIDTETTYRGTRKRNGKAVPSIKQERTVSLSESASRWFAENQEKYLRLHAEPLYRPMLCRPLDWSTLNDGGYLVLRLELVRHRGSGRIKDALNTADLSGITKTVNAIQSTPWRVNALVHDYMQYAWDEGVDFPVEEDSADSQLFERVKDNGHRLSAPPELLESNGLVGQEFFYPHFLDFRGRAYARASALQPQSGDISRGLLVFADAKPIDQVGAKWLRIHLANKFGKDKVSYRERQEWVEQNEASILKLAETARSLRSPTDSVLEFWRKSKKRWQFLAACLEWERFRRDGEAATSSLPISIDGTCNGLQHLSALARDEVGGAATNLIPDERPSDIYAVVQNRLDELLAIDEKDGRLEAQLLRPFITRDVVKSATMTTPYGVTRQGIQDQLREELHKPKHRKWAATVKAATKEAQIYESQVLRHLGDRLKSAIEDVVICARDIEDWLSEKLAGPLAKKNQNLLWTSPVGFPVVHDYRQDTRLRISAGGIEISIRKPKGKSPKIDIKKQKQSVVPNFIHSLDAAHMMRTVAALRDGRGLKHFLLVHDNFGVHGCDMDFLSEVVRDEFVRIHQTPLLEQIYNEQVSRAPELKDLLCHPTEYIKMGKLDIASVRDSEYFFT